MLPERCYTMDVLSPVMVVGTAERHILVYDLNNPNQPFKVCYYITNYDTTVS